MLILLVRVQRQSQHKVPQVLYTMYMYVCGSHDNDKGPCIGDTEANPDSGWSCHTRPKRCPLGTVPYNLNFTTFDRPCCHATNHSVPYLTVPILATHTPMLLRSTLHIRS